MKAKAIQEVSGWDQNPWRKETKTFPNNCRPQKLALKIDNHLLLHALQIKTQKGVAEDIRMKKKVPSQPAFFPLFEIHTSSYFPFNIATATSFWLLYQTQRLKLCRTHLLSMAIKITHLKKFRLPKLLLQLRKKQTQNEWRGSQSLSALQLCAMVKNV